MKKIKLKTKLIFAILAFLLAIVILVLGIWSSQAGKNLFKGYLELDTVGINARVTAMVSGVKIKEGEGYSTERVMWDSEYTVEENQAIKTWNDIDFTFEDRKSIIELVVKVENRNVGRKIKSDFVAYLDGNQIPDDGEVVKELGNTNILAYVERQDYVEGAYGSDIHSFAYFKVVLRVWDTNKSIKDMELSASLTLTDVDPTQNPIA